MHCRFPNNPCTRQKWADAVGRGNWTPSKNNVLCSRHFLDEDMDRTSLSCVRVREHAVPRLFNSIPIANNQRIKPSKPKVRTATRENGYFVLEINSIIPLTIICIIYIELRVWLYVLTVCILCYYL